MLLLRFIFDTCLFDTAGLTGDGTRLTVNIFSLRRPGPVSPRVEWLILIWLLVRYPVPRLGTCDAVCVWARRTRTNSKEDFQNGLHPMLVVDRTCVKSNFGICGSLVLHRLFGRKESDHFFL